MSRGDRRVVGAGCVGDGWAMGAGGFGGHRPVGADGLGGHRPDRPGGWVAIGLIGRTAALVTGD
ncbi:hypothetical protein ACFZC7_33240 [Streptomyces massasporeus]|uniref:hypothetical protein n=1 Tax=Streptomyces massasporeus TaxID=67324 RepID=UPI0036E1C139